MNAISIALLAAAAVFTAMLLAQRQRITSRKKAIRSLQKFVPTDQLISKPEKLQVQLLSNSLAKVGAFEKRFGQKFRLRQLAHLQAAGLYANNAVSHLWGQKVVAALLGVWFGVTVSRSDSRLLWALVFAVASFYVPDLAVRRLATKRVAAIDSALSDSIDLLHLCVTSGLNFEQALSRVTLATDGPLSQELSHLLTQLQLGVSRTEAIESLMTRTRSEELRRLLASFLQVEGLGVSLSSMLATQAKTLRTKRKDSAREQAQKVAVKIVIPLMFCFLPAIFIIVAGPAIVGLIQSFGSL
ncbi:MAG: hypothetical protein RL556_388 [Actinomycetota bacterium]|jgi:tight adherence protein C